MARFVGKMYEKSMIVLKTDIPGVCIVEPSVFGDSRGYFFESYNAREFESAVGDVRFVQDNESFSTYGVVRGLHFQKGEWAQAKLVRAVRGRIWDVCVDLRKGSPTFGKWMGVELSGENHRQLFIPRGLAHGFSVLSPDALFQYKCDNFYAPESAGSIDALDQALGIDWQIKKEDMVRSEKDLKAPLFEALPGDSFYD